MWGYSYNTVVWAFSTVSGHKSGLCIISSHTKLQNHDLSTGSVESEQSRSLTVYTRVICHKQPSPTISLYTFSNDCGLITTPGMIMIIESLINIESHCTTTDPCTHHLMCTRIAILILLLPPNTGHSFTIDHWCCKHQDQCCKSPKPWLYSVLELY